MTPIENLLEKMGLCRPESLSRPSYWMMAGAGMLILLFLFSLILPVQAPLMFLAGVLLAGGLIVNGFAKLKKVVRSQAVLFGEIRRQAESLAVYTPKLNEVIARIKDNDFSMTVVPPDAGAARQSEQETLFVNLREASEKIKAATMQNQRISVDLVRSTRALMEAGNIQASGSAEQASSISEITATMEELARTAAQIAENSNKVARLAENSDHASREGSTLIGNVIQHIEKVDEKMHQITQKTQVLGSQSKQIGKVLEIIFNIANETHLLALNAAIESVAAGEFGKRFGVVAAEVRRLAEISRENAESIRTIIEQFQNSIDTTTMAVEEGTKMTSGANQMAQEIVKQFDRIVQAVATTSQSTHEISIATQQQRSASDQIVLTLKDISQVTKQQAGELKRSSKELEKINSLSLNLQLITQQTVINSPLSLGFKIVQMAQRPEIMRMDPSLHQQVLAQITEENHYIELVYCADSEGKMFSFSLGKQGGDIPEILSVGHDFSNRPWFVNAAGHHRPYISEVYKSLFSGEDCFSVSISVFSPEGQLAGVLAMDINAKEWNKIAL